MQILTREELDGEREAYDALVAQTPDIDGFCSSSYWIFPADAALMPPRAPFIRRYDSGYVVLARGRHPDGWSYLQPFEAMWGLACPFVGPDPEALVADFWKDARLRLAAGEALLLSGVAVGSKLHQALREAPRASARAGGRLRVQELYPCRRYAASLEGGLDGFLSRRSRKLRANLRRSQRMADAEGVEFEEMPHRADPHALYGRILATEALSWKSAEGAGISVGEMRRFYDLMIPRMLARGALRGLFARKDGQDVGYLLGGVFHDTFRGLQFSYDARLAHLSLGSLMQVEMVSRLEGHGLAWYDLGSEVEYKKQWGEAGLETLMFVVVA